MRRRINRDVLVLEPPKKGKREYSYKKNYKYINCMNPFNIWFRSQLKKTGGLKTFCSETKISYETAKCWTYKTQPRINSIFDIAIYLGKKLHIPHMEIVKEIKLLKRSKK